MSGATDKFARFHETAANISNAMECESEYEKRRAAIEQLKKMNGKLVVLAVDKIETTRNVRSEVEQDGDFEALVESIRTVGLLSPIVVTCVDDSVLCVAGHRRLAALKTLGVEKANCLYREFASLDEVAMAQLVENMVRSDLALLDVAEAFHALRERGYSQEKISQIFDKSRFTIGRYQKIAEWPEEAKVILRQYRSSFSTRELIHLASRSLTDVEIVLWMRTKVGLEKALTAPTSAALDERLQATRGALGIPIALRGNEEKGSLTLKYKSKEELEAILQKLN